VIVALLAAIGGWQAARRAVAPTGDQTSPLADPSRR
jgi:hypothetical protein